MTNKVIFWLDADITNFSISYYLQKISGAEFYAIIDITDKPKKDWLTSLTDFLIPQWIRDFAKDALGTVTGWLGLTEKDAKKNGYEINVGKFPFSALGKALADGDREGFVKIIYDKK